jgi:hypothetical protein
MAHTQRVAAVMLSLVIAVTAGARGLAATGPATIRIADLQSSDLRLGQGIGAREIVRAALYRREGRPRRLGASAMLCTWVDTRLRTCGATYILPLGSLIVSGILTTRLLYQLAVIGGTGLYDNARGSLTVTAYSLHPRRDVLIFLLTG